MINQRKHQIEYNGDFVFCGRTDNPDAFIRVFGNSETVPYGTLMKDITKVSHLDDCSLLFLKIFDENVFSVFENFTYTDLVYSRMSGETEKKNKYGVLISKEDIQTAYQKYKEVK